MSCRRFHMRGDRRCEFGGMRCRQKMTPALNCCHASLLNMRSKQLEILTIAGCGYFPHGP